MDLPDYWLVRPQTDLDDATRAAFDALIPATPDPAGCPTVQYNLSAPKWQFLCHAAEQHNLALHGSGNPNVTCFEPRQSNDLSAFGNRKAVYAASDGLWATFFAIVDRDRYAMSVTNACVRLVDESGVTRGPYYVFSVSRSVLPERPWRTGTVYLLPRATFVPQEPMPFGTSQVLIAQLASLLPVQPLAKLTVTPADFPFLAHIRGHDDQRLAEYAAALQAGAPWPEDKE
jgi:hypothetical protein